VRDHDNEEQAQATFDAMMREFADVRARISSDLQAKGSVQRSKQGDLIVAQRKQAELSEDLENTTELLSENRI
jgi:hypothetical protein